MNETTSLNSIQFRNEKITIVLVSCSPLILQAMKSAIEKQHDMEIVAETIDCEQAFSLVATLHPDVCIIEIDIPNFDVLETTRQIIQIHAEIKILLLSFRDESIPIFEIMHAGASGYLTKYTPPDGIVHAVRAIVAGRRVFAEEDLPRDTAAYDFSTKSLLVRSQNITNRELAMLKLVAKGMSNKEMSAKMGLSLPNIKISLTTIFRKLGVSSRTEATSYCLKAGIINMNDLV